MKKYNSQETRGISTNLFYIEYLPNGVQRTKQLLQQQDNFLPFLIHPFFTQQEKKHIFTDNQKTQLPKEVIEIALEEYNTQLLQLLANPLISILALGEYGPLIASSIELIRQIGYLGDILVYETKDADPQPIRSQGSWKKLGNILKNLRIENIHVAGQKTIFDPTQTDIHLPKGCVPRFVAELRSQLPGIANNIFISPTTYPNWWKKNKRHPFFTANLKSQQR